jgi:hypothetical protein
MGYRVLCFWDHEIQTEIQHLLEQIRGILIEAPSPLHPSERAGALPSQPTNSAEEPKKPACAGSGRSSTGRVAAVSRPARLARPLRPARRAHRRT